MEGAREPVSLETAARWLASVRAPSLLALLRDPEFALVSVTAFAGFRVNATGSANPLVRRRLAQEILQNDKFAEKIKALAEETPPLPERQGVEAKPVTSPAPPERPNREEELRAERDRRRRERDEARQSLAVAEAARAQTEETLSQAEETRDAQARLVQQQAHRIVRLERQVTKMQTEQMSLLKALRQDKVSAPPRPGNRSSSAPASPEMSAGRADPWQEAVRHLLHKERFDTALALALDVLRGDPDNRAALDIAARAYERKDEAREAAGQVRRLLAAHLAHDEMADAAETLVRLLPLLPRPPDAGRDVRQWLSQLRVGNGTAVAAGRVALERLRALMPEGYAWLASEVAAAAPALAEELMPPPGALGPDDPLPAPLPGHWTARRLVDAVNANEERDVAAAREALASLQSKHPGDWQRVWEGLARAAGDDDSALIPLRRAPRGPAVVDGSNAAWFDQHSYAAPRPRLRSLLELRRVLRRRGFFPVLLYADAPLPYTVDDPSTLRALLGRQEITLVDGGVDADEVLLREAKRLRAPLVTNDYMTDWDPEGEVEKIRFTISQTGEAHLLT